MKSTLATCLLVSNDLRLWWHNALKWMHELFINWSGCYGNNSRSRACSPVWSPPSLLSIFRSCVGGWLGPPCIQLGVLGVKVCRIAGMLSILHPEFFCGVPGSISEYGVSFALSLFHKVLLRISILFIDFTEVMDSLIY